MYWKHGFIGLGVVLTLCTQLQAWSHDRRGSPGLFDFDNDEDQHRGGYHTHDHDHIHHGHGHHGHGYHKHTHHGSGHHDHTHHGSGCHGHTHHGGEHNWDGHHGFGNSGDDRFHVKTTPAEISDAKTVTAATVPMVIQTTTEDPNDSPKIDRRAMFG